MKCDARVDGGWWTYDHYLTLSGLVEPKKVIQGFCCECWRDLDKPEDYTEPCKECGGEILGIFTKKRLQK